MCVCCVYIYIIIYISVTLFPFKKKKRERAFFGAWPRFSAAASTEGVCPSAK